MLITEPDVHSSCSNLPCEVSNWLLTKQESAIKIIKINVKGRRVCFYYQQSVEDTNEDSKHLYSKF